MASKPPSPPPSPSPSPSPPPSPPPYPSRLLIVSNRLPISTSYENDTYKFSQGSGGLITGLSGFTKSTQFRWYGWTGLEIPEAARDGLAERLKTEYDSIPIFLDNELADLYYNKFASQSLVSQLHCSVYTITNRRRRHNVAPHPLSPW